MQKLFGFTLLVRIRCFGTAAIVRPRAPPTGRRVHNVLAGRVGGSVRIERRAPLNPIPSFITRLCRRGSLELSAGSQAHAWPKPQVVVGAGWAFAPPALLCPHSCLACSALPTPAYYTASPGAPFTVHRVNAGTKKKMGVLSHSVHQWACHVSSSCFVGGSCYTESTSAHLSHPVNSPQSSPTAACTYLSPDPAPLPHARPRAGISLVAPPRDAPSMLHYHK